MAEWSVEERQAALQHLAQRLHAWHLAGVAGLLLSIGRSVPVVCSHALLFVQPLAPVATWRTSLGLYAAALEDDASWQALLALLNASDS